MKGEKVKPHSLKKEKKRDYREQHEETHGNTWEQM